MNENNKQITYHPFGYKTTFSVIFMEEIPSTLSQVGNFTYKKILVVFDTNLPKTIVVKLTNLFRNNERKVELMPFVHGPKSLQKVVSMWKIMVDFVPEVIVGIGGGTVSDLVGFAASTYQRGIPHIIFPTTVLGMIDASIGGKTAIDFHGLKNCIGAVHYPLGVINIMDTLKTLPQDEFVSGLAEAVKAAVLFDADFFHKLEKYASEQDFSYKNYRLLEIMKHSASLKMKNSEAPPHHKIKLLYGHAVGHALEILAQGKIRHGEGVAIGMTVEGAVACLLGIWDRNEWIRQTQLLKKLYLPTSVPPKYTTRMIIEKMKKYKKLVSFDAFGFVLLKKMGDVAFYHSESNFLTYIKKNDFLNILNEALKFMHERT